MIWPAATRSGQPRQIEDIREIVQKINEKEGPLLQEEVKGIIGASIFLDIEGFDFINDIPCEYLHSVCLGVIKRLLELTFSLGDKRIRVTTRKLSKPKTYNDVIKAVKCPREFSRRSRSLDLGVMLSLIHI